MPLPEDGLSGRDILQGFLDYHFPDRPSQGIDRIKILIHTSHTDNRSWVLELKNQE
jgi:hypothetical protein